MRPGTWRYGGDLPNPTREQMVAWHNAQLAQAEERRAAEASRAAIEAAEARLTREERADRNHRLDIISNFNSRASAMAAEQNIPLKEAENRLSWQEVRAYRANMDAQAAAQRKATELREAQAQRTREDKTFASALRGASSPNPAIWSNPDAYFNRRLSEVYLDAALVPTKAGREQLQREIEAGTLLIGVRLKPSPIDRVKRDILFKGSDDVGSPKQFWVRQQRPDRIDVQFYGPIPVGRAAAG
jgi:hypothetical protein